MIWGTSEIISFLSEIFILKPGDLIFTGTPDGIGRIERGDHLFGEIEKLTTLEITIR